MIHFPRRFDWARTLDTPQPVRPDIRTRIRTSCLIGEAACLQDLRTRAGIDEASRKRISARAVHLVETIRRNSDPGLMEAFLAEYGLSTDEGIALMCLAEALLRVPDADTIDELIEDKIAPSAWGRHLGRSSSSLVNASTWALMLTGKVLDDEGSAGVAAILHGLIKRVGEPVIRTAVRHAMRELGGQFVLGETMAEALKRGEPEIRAGYTFSYDMLGEAALTAGDAETYLRAYSAAIAALADRATASDIRDNPGISIKLSALHPRYEVGQKRRVMDELVDRVRTLVLAARDANLGLNIDAEEADRLDLSLDVIEALVRDPRLAGWDGFGVVVQAYSKRAGPVVDWLHGLAGERDRKLMVRLVKGAYWDAEIKRAQVEGLAGFPVFTRKAATDVSYLCCARRLLAMTDRIYPQFATHNAHTVAAIVELAPDLSAFEFQRLHGMGEALHRTVMAAEGTRCRIYAPVGAHRDLLAYLVRRLLENGANSSFVNQIVDETVPAAEVATDPFDLIDRADGAGNPAIARPAGLYAPERENSRGWDLHNTDDIAAFEAAREPFRQQIWDAGPRLATSAETGPPQPIVNPANPDDTVGHVRELTVEGTDAALAAARPWPDHDDATRKSILLRASHLYEEHAGEFFAAMAREAGKTPIDAVAELREAVDFLRYYAARIDGLPNRQPRGLFACISPWNFPLAIFTGQIAAALAAGNGVLAKPAESTPITAAIAVRLLHAAGVPHSALQLLPGRGPVVGARLTAHPDIAGVCFTGSTDTALAINRSMAKAVDPAAPLIAETGGLNAMIVDSTALPEQAVRDIVASAFRSAGQRCSALRILFLQEEIAGPFQDMLFGAMDELVVGDPWSFATDIGPVIDGPAQAGIADHIERAKQDGRLLKQRPAPARGTFVGPAAIAVNSIADLKREIFGPVLHIARFRADRIGNLVDDINARGFGLTFGLHTRIDDRVEQITARLRVGNMYINRNQIGAIVGSQPFGGEGLSGTGPKAGGPHYVRRFTRISGIPAATPPPAGTPVDRRDVQAMIDQRIHAYNEPVSADDLPGPTGESNRLSLYPRGVVLCLGPGPVQAGHQARIAHDCGCEAVIVAPGATGPDAIDGALDLSAITALRGISVVALFGAADELRAARRALADRQGAIVPLAAEPDFADLCLLERHVCIDTTAAGGNATLLAAGAGPRSRHRLPG